MTQASPQEAQGQSAVPNMPASLEELAGSSEAVATLQREVGQAFGSLYADPRTDINKLHPEIALRNPVVYADGLNLYAIPDQNLREGWTHLLAKADDLAKRASTRQPAPEWSPDAHGLAKLRALMESGDLNAENRSEIGSVIGRASRLFARSTTDPSMSRGDTRYFAGNVWDAAHRLDRYRRASVSSTVGSSATTHATE